MRARRGLSLIEAMVALVIVALLAAALFDVLTGSARAVKMDREWMAAARTASMLLETSCARIVAAAPTDASEELSVVPDFGAGPGRAFIEVVPLSGAVRAWRVALSLMILSPGEPRTIKLERVVTDPLAGFSNVSEVAP